MKGSQAINPVSTSALYININAKPPLLGTYFLRDLLRGGPKKKKKKKKFFFFEVKPGRYLRIFCVKNMGV
jgi:hypothetical protein